MTVLAVAFLLTVSKAAHNRSHRKNVFVKYLHIIYLHPSCTRCASATHLSKDKPSGSSPCRMNAHEGVLGRPQMISLRHKEGRHTTSWKLTRSPFSYHRSIVAETPNVPRLWIRQLACHSWVRILFSGGTFVRYYSSCLIRLRFTSCISLTIMIMIIIALIINSVFSIFHFHFVSGL